MTLDLRPPYVLLEDRLAAGAPARLYRDPVEIVRCDRPDEVRRALVRVEQATVGGLHAAGFIGYEAASALEPRLARGFQSAGTPLLWFGLFRPAEELSGEVRRKAAGAAARRWRPARRAAGRADRPGRRSCRADVPLGRGNHSM